MTSYYKVTNLIKEILQSNEDVHTVVHGKVEDKDIYKKNIYPLAHLNPTGSDFSNVMISQFTFDIAVLSVRDISNDDDYDKFEGNDNEIDNLNTCHAVLNDLVTTLRLQPNNDLIEVISVSGAIPVLFKEHNLLDGWIITITLGIPNNVISTCD